MDKVQVKETNKEMNTETYGTFFVIYVLKINLSIWALILVCLTA